MVERTRDLTAVAVSASRKRGPPTGPACRARCSTVSPTSPDCEARQSAGEPLRVLPKAESRQERQRRVGPATSRARTSAEGHSIGVRKFGRQLVRIGQSRGSGAPARPRCPSRPEGRWWNRSPTGPAKKGRSCCASPSKPAVRAHGTAAALLPAAPLIDRDDPAFNLSLSPAGDRVQSPADQSTSTDPTS